jgi:uncharacterized protein YkwD
MVTFTRRLVPLFLAGLLLAPMAAPVGAEVTPIAAKARSTAPEDTSSAAALLQDGLDLVKLTNAKRAALGLVALRADSPLMAIARDRARVMAANDVMSHTEPDGTKVWDRMNDAGLTWFAAGEILAWNHYPVQYSTAEAIRAWMASPGHRAIMVSTGYNYVGFGAAVSASGRRYYAGVFAKRPDHTGPWAKFGRTSMSTVDARHKRVTVRWSGGDTRLQVLTSGLRYYQVHWRRVGGAWHSWGTTTATRKSATFVRGVGYEVRVRSRDRAGNWGTWRTIAVRP